MINSLLDTLREDLAQYMPERTVTREYKDREEHLINARKRGVLTIVFTGESSPDENFYQHLNLLVYGSVQLEEGATGLDVERAEIDFLQKLKFFQRAPGGAHLTIGNTVTSHQVEKPYGWFVCECTLGPFDLTAEQKSWDNAFTEMPELFISREPDIGLAHKPDYKNVEDV